MSGRLAAQRRLLSIDRTRRSPTERSGDALRPYKKRLATALAAAALASALAVSGAHAHYGSQSPGSPEVAPPASSIAALRRRGVPGSSLNRTGDLAEGSRPTPAQQPVVDEPSGFDPVSAAIGAVAAAALSLVLMATLSTRRPTGRRAASA